MQYYYAIGQQQVGPISFDELKQVNIMPDTLVWRDGLATWVEASTLTELAILFAPAQPTIPNIPQIPAGQTPQQPISQGNNPSQVGHQQPSQSAGFGQPSQPTQPTQSPDQAGYQQTHQGYQNQVLPSQVSAPQGYGYPPYQQQSQTNSGLAQTRYAQFIERLGAAVIDGILCAVVSYALAALFGVMFNLPSMEDLTRDETTDGTPLLYYPLNIVIRWVYEAYLVSSPWQATLGKRAFGLVVTDLQGGRLSFAHGFGRVAAKLISDLTCLIGYFMMFTGDKSQTLHDRVAGTLVLKNIK